jgi:hypothetical protein
MSEPRAAGETDSDTPADPGLIDEPSLLRIYLAGRDVACPQCGYNLRELRGTRCPECGEELTLRVQPVEPRQAAPLAGLVILSAGAGMNALLLIYLLIQLYYYDRGGVSGWGKFAAVNVVEGLVLGGCVAAWLLCWRRIRRLDVPRRWLLVAACAALTLADLVFFAKLVR